MTLFGVILLSPFVHTALALQIERPGMITEIKKSIGNGYTDGNATVSLGVFIDNYEHSNSYYGGNSCIGMNVSFLSNTRMGIRYTYEVVDCLYDWMMESYSLPAGPGEILQEFTNCGDDWGAWVYPGGGFRFQFYGGKYKNVYYEYMDSHVWICTNGFIAFDLSNSTVAKSYSIPNPNPPNAVIAALWRDLVIDSESKIIVMRSPAWGKSYLVIIWKNAFDKSTGKRLTFAVALEEYLPVDEGNPYLFGGLIYVAYQDVGAVDGYFVYGVEDHEGRKGAGKCAYGSELSSLNGKTLIFYQCTPNYFVKHLYLQFEDTSWPNVRYDIRQEGNAIYGSNLKTKIDPPPQPNENLMFAKSIASAGSFITGKAGAAMGLSSLTAVGTFVSFGLMAWGLYDLYVVHQYNSIEWLELKDSESDPGIQRAFIKVPANSSTVVDASLNIFFYWIFPQDVNVQHNLTITAICEYEEFPNGIFRNVTSSLNIKMGRDNNDNWDYAYTVSDGFYGVDPMLWLGGYDTQDYYRIALVDSNKIEIKLYPPYQVDFDLYLYDPGRNLTAWSENRGDAVESITYTADSSGYWFIKVQHVAGWGFYNLSISVERREACPFLFVWNGHEYVIDNNLLPAFPKNNMTDAEDYYKLEQNLIPSFQGKIFSLYSLQIGEFENEHSYIDQVKLLAVDHNPDFRIAVTPNGEIVNYWQPLPPISCVDNYGNSRLSEILHPDANISKPATYFYGIKGDYLILNFGRINAEYAKLILRSDMKCQDTSIYPPCCIDVQILKNGEWQTVVVIAPREYWAVEAVNLTAYISADQDLMVRLYWTLPHRLDYVGLDTSPPDQIKITEASLIRATHSNQEDVTAKLLFNDQKYAELTPGEQINLTFVLPNKPPNKTRTFIFYTEGHYYTIKE
jgi:hypothetical protein